MKTTLLSLKAFFTICLLCLVGGVNAMADTYTYTFKEGDLTTPNPKDYTFNDVKWSVSGKIAKIAWDTSNGKGFQLATGKSGSNESNVTFTTSAIPGTITSVTVNASTNSKGSADITVKVGSNDWGTKQCDKTPKDYTFTGEATGTISINLDNTKSKKGLYIKSITVEYTTGNVISAPTITPTTQEFSKPFTATISSVEGATIYYTIDGSDPKTSTTRSEYTTGVEISAATTTLKAVAIKDGTASKVAEAVYTYVVPTYAYTIWSEDWSSFNADETQPAEGVNATYSYVSDQTKIYNDVLAGGEKPELLISKKSNSGSFTVKIKDLKGHSGTFQFTLFANKENFEVETIGGQLIGERTKEVLNNNGKTNDKYTYTIAVPQNTKNLELTIKTTADNTNVRVDNLSLSAKLVILGTGTFTITPARYGTYYTEDAFVMPEGVIGYTITSEDDQTLKFNEAYVAGAVVPAKTALVLKATEELTANKEYTYTIVNSTAVAPTDNLLHGSIEDAITSVEDAKAYYKLANPTEGIGFYYGAEDGGAFKNGAHKAYLAVMTKAMSQMRGFSFDSMTTGINHVVANAEHAKSTVIYDLNGRRVNSLNAAAKGVYIVNGKKVIVK